MAAKQAKKAEPASEPMAIAVHSSYTEAWKTRSGIEYEQPNLAAIHSQLVDAMRLVGTIGKDSKAPAAMGGYRFRGIDALLNQLHPAFITVGVHVVPELLSEERSSYETAKKAVMFHSSVRVRFTFYSVLDGSSVAAVAAGEGVDTGDKATGKAITSAFKSAMWIVLSVPTENAEDTEGVDLDIAAGSHRRRTESYSDTHPSDGDSSSLPGAADPDPQQTATPAAINLFWARLRTVMKEYEIDDEAHMRIAADFLLKPTGLDHSTMWTRTRMEDGEVRVDSVALLASDIPGLSERVANFDPSTHKELEGVDVHPPDDVPEKEG